MRAKAQRELINSLSEEDMPRRGTYTPTFYDTSTRLTLMAEAVEREGLEDGDQVTEHYFEEEGVVVVDLRGGEDGTQ